MTLEPTSAEIREEAKAGIDQQIDDWRAYRATLHPTYEAEAIEKVDVIIDGLIDLKNSYTGQPVLSRLDLSQVDTQPAQKPQGDARGGGALGPVQARLYGWLLDMILGK